MLLMEPALGVFASQVEPDRRRIRSCPIDRASDCERIERFEVAAHLLARVPEQIAQQRRAHSPCSLHPRFIHAIDQRDQFLPTYDRFVGEAVAFARENADVATKKMQGNIFD